MNNLTEKEHKAIKEFVEGLKKMYADNLSKIILYGSKAIGRATKDSDIDIMIILKKYDRFDVEFEKVHKVVYEVEEKYDYDMLISTIIKREEEFLYQNTPLLLNIRKEGINIWTR